MSDAATAVTTQRDEELPPPGPGRVLGRVQRIGYAVLVVQLAGFLAWSAVLYAHFAVTSDFATYNQPWYLIAHGNLDPNLSIAGIPFWRSDSEFMPWVLAPLYWVARTSFVLPVVQDVSIAGAQVVAFTWLCELARRHCRESDLTAAWLAAAGLLLIVANPWTWWTVSFDVHEEAFIMLPAALLAWDLFHGRRRAWLWAVLAMLGGAPSASYVIGVGAGGVLAGRRTRRLGAQVAAAALAYSVLIVAVHGDLGVPLAKHYGYLAASGAGAATLSFGGLVKGLVTHPLNVPLTLWDKRADILANLLPGGLLGVGAPFLLPLMVVVLLANSLSQGYLFTEPLFQSLPVYVLLPVGTVAALAWVLRRHRRAALVLGCLIAAQAVGWAAVWGPRTASQWQRVPGATAATLAGVQARIPPSAEVIASQGIAGRFAGRVHLYEFPAAGTSRLHGETWFVIVPQDGIEMQSTASAMATIGELAGPLGATLITHANGVWAFRLDPPGGTGTFIPPGDFAPLPAWAASGAAARPVLDGPVSRWHLAATGAKGYVADGLAWQEPPGRYLATVTLSASVPVNVEVWDDTTGTLLARRSIPGTRGIEQVAMPASVPAAPDATVYPGWGPFRADFTLPPPGQRTEVRVWSPGGGAVSVYGADLSPAG